MGFDKVYDTSFTADLTVIEEGNEFIERATKGKLLPQFTSCCPGWVKFAEQYYPEFTPNLSTCKSPQQMFGSLAKDMLPSKLNVKKEDLVVVSIMPCTAKKFEAKREEFRKDGVPDVDHVLTTQEIVRMIEETGIDFNSLEPESFDMPLGFKTGAGVIFGSSGGVTEAVLRYVTEKLTGKVQENYEFTAVRGEEGIREASLEVNGKEYKLCVAHGLANARRVIEKIDSGEAYYDLVEIMACPGGCVGGAGQPCYKNIETRRKRTKGVYENDRMMQLHKSQENPYILELYTKEGFSDKHKAHELLHTTFRNFRRTETSGITIAPAAKKAELSVDVCFGTGCFVRGSQETMKKIVNHIETTGLRDRVEVRASFCFESCERGPVVKVGSKVIEKGNLDEIYAAIDAGLREKAKA
jgi:NADH-quinone oxidoreductase subunit G